MSNAAQRRAAQLRRMRARRGGRLEEDRVPLRLAVCGILFVLVVAVKLLFPDAVGQMADSARRLIGQDADFRAAFAAMGRAVSGEEAVGDSLQEAYAAVFSPSSEIPAEEPPQPAAASQEASAPDAAPSEDEAPAGTPAAPADPGAHLLRYSVLPLPEADKAVMRELLIAPEDGAASSPPAGEGSVLSETPPLEEEDAVAEASQVFAMAALPENASLEQRNLGFAHCTPVPGRLSSTFGWREHPIEGGSRFHYGLDLAAEEGTDVVAFADGEVYAAGESSSLGNYIMLRHEEGYMTLYAHCSRITASGGSVAMGEKIAEVGSTGLATGPHLHFELHDGDLYLNPIYYVAVG